MRTRLWIVGTVALVLFVGMSCLYTVNETDRFGRVTMRSSVRILFRAMVLAAVASAGAPGCGERDDGKVQLTTVTFEKNLLRNPSFENVKGAVPVGCAPGMGYRGIGGGTGASAVLC